MRTSITSDQGVVTTRDGDGLTINGRDIHEAPFDQRWDDLYACIDTGTGPAALTYEAYRDTGFFMRFFRHNQDDFVFMSYQMPHSWDPTTSVYPHMHCIPMGSGSGVVKMNYAYTWCGDHGEFFGASGWTSGSITASYDASHQHKQDVIIFGPVQPLTGAYESDVLLFKVERPGSSDPADTYTAGKSTGTAAANLGVLFFDLHYQKIKQPEIL